MFYSFHLCFSKYSFSYLFFISKIQFQHFFPFFFKFSFFCCRIFVSQEKKGTGVKSNAYLKGSNWAYKEFSITPNLPFYRALWMIRVGNGWSRFCLTLNFWEKKTEWNLIFECIYKAKYDIYILIYYILFSLQLYPKKYSLALVLSDTKIRRKKIFNINLNKIQSMNSISMQSNGEANEMPNETQAKCSWQQQQQE